MYGKFFLVLFSLLLLILSTLSSTGTSAGNAPKENVGQCADGLLPLSTRAGLVHEASNCDAEAQ